MEVTVSLLFWVAALLSLERIAYVFIYHHANTFRAWSTSPKLAALGGPVELLATLFVAFKAIQAGVFLWWHLTFGDGTMWPHSSDPRVLAAGALLAGLGQALNFSVFLRLGTTGVFYGNRFGFSVSWCRSFPFTWFDHPQYVGTVVTIWGLFVLMRFPASDWMVIPLLESVYYAAGARLERDPT